MILCKKEIEDLAHIAKETTGALYQIHQCPLAGVENEQHEVKHYRYVVEMLGTKDVYPLGNEL